MFFNRSRTRFAVFEMNKGEFKGLQIRSQGSVMQLVSDEILCNFKPFQKGIWDFYYKPLKYREHDLGCSWWMRRGLRFLPWLVLWKIDRFLERVYWRFIHLAAKLGFFDWSEFEKFSWKYWRWKFWRRRLQQKKNGPRAS